MCQYQSECPTTRHRPGTQCPVRVSIENHNRKVDQQNRATIWGVVFLVVIAALVFSFYLLFIRSGATGIGVPAIDELFLSSPYAVGASALLSA